jgi:hypothetical protein
MAEHRPLEFAKTTPYSPRQWVWMIPPDAPRQTREGMQMVSITWG